MQEVAQHPVAHALAAVCAHLAPEPIPRELLDAWSIPRESATDTLGGVDDAIDVLLGYALLTPGSNQTVSMHRLVQHVARSGSDARQQASGARGAVGLLDGALPGTPWEHEHWPLCARLLPHAVAASEHARRHGVAPLQTASVLIRVGQYQQARGEYAEAKRHTQCALTILEAAFGPRHPQVARALDDHGNVLLRLGQLTPALRAHERALLIEERVLGPDHARVGGTLTSLGIALLALSRPAEARAVLDRALAIKESVYGPEDARVASTLSNLGNALARLRDLESARSAHERALATFESAYGSRHPQVARALRNLAIVLLQSGDLRTGRYDLERAVDILDEAYGPSHPEASLTRSILRDCETGGAGWYRILGARRKLRTATVPGDVELGFECEPGSWGLSLCEPILWFRDDASTIRPLRTGANPVGRPDPVVVDLLAETTASETSGISREPSSASTRDQRPPRLSQLVGNRVPRTTPLARRWVARRFGRGRYGGR